MPAYVLTKVLLCYIEKKNFNILYNGGEILEFIQDYIMRLIHEMVRLILKILFNINDKQCIQKIEENQEEAEKYNTLIFLLNQGNIDEAENLLYDSCDYNNKNDLLIGIQFYNYLNQFDDDYLENHNFSRQEVKEGLETLIINYGYKDLI